MRLVSRFLSFCCLLLTSATASATPAHPGSRIVTNPDGSTVTLRLIGDELGHVTVDADGRPVEQDADGYWRHTDITIHDAIDKGRRARRAARRAVIRTHFPRTGQVRSLVVLVDFPDVPFVTADIRREVSEMLNLPGFDRREHIGCAADYFRAQSGGAFDPTFDVYGPVRASRPATYYGENDANGDDSRVYELAVELCRALDSEIDFADYDLDGDGYIDNLYFFYAGYGENFAGNKASWIWPHAAHMDEYGVAEADRTFDGKVLNSYGCCAELYGSTGADVASIGTFCHEFGHILGLPDTYDVNYAADGSGNHPDKWDIMASGSYLPATRNCGAVPAGYTAVERWLLGWAEPVEITAPQRVTLRPLHESAQSARISTAEPDEFFILENRQNHGYDRYLPSHGLLVWHVDRRTGAYINVTLGDESKTISCADAWELEYNAVNANAAHQCLEIEKASGNDGSKSTADTPFPGRQMRTEFTDATSPSMRSWSGAATGRPVTGIAERDGVITFDFMGGTSEPDAIVTLPATDITATAFTARWEPAAHAVDGYTVTLYSVERTAVQDALTLDAALGSLPAGWSVEGGAAFNGSALTLGGDAASSLTTAPVDLSRGGTLIVRASQPAGSSASLKIYAGDELIDVYPPGTSAADFEIDIAPTDARTITLGVDRRRSVVLHYLGLRQDAELTALTPIDRATEQGTSHRFTCPAPDAEYAYTVGAVGYASGESEPQHVALGAAASIDEADCRQGSATYYNLQGIPVAHPAPGQIIIRIQNNRINKVKL